MSAEVEKMKTALSVAEVQSPIEHASAFAGESEHRACLSAHNGKSYAVLLEGYVFPLAVFGYSDLAVKWRDANFPGADVAEINALFPESGTLSATKVSQGELGHALSS